MGKFVQAPFGHSALGVEISDTKVDFDCAAVHSRASAVAKEHWRPGALVINGEDYFVAGQTSRCDPVLVNLKDPSFKAQEATLEKARTDAKNAIARIQKTFAFGNFKSPTGRQFLITIPHSWSDMGYACPLAHFLG